MTSTNIQQPDSLVKYGNPVLVSTSGKKHKDKKDTKTPQPNISGAYTEDILNSILPPRQYTMDKQQLWQLYLKRIQSVAAVPATKQDVLDLQAKLDQRLQTRQARQTGICPIRQELYAQCFDQLIRQITINCAERGLLLVRVRDQIRMAYQTLYQSSIAYGMRKALQSQQKKKEMENKIQNLKNECYQLEKQVSELQKKIEDIERTDNEQRQADYANHRNSVQNQKKTNNILRQQLEKLLSGPQQLKK